MVDIYSSLPLTGPSAPAGTAIARGIQLAVTQSGGRAGSFRVEYRSLDDARRGQGPWDYSQTAANARRALTDPRAVVYIGDLDSAASQISLPILNQAGLPQISPWSPYVGLTQGVSDVTGPGEPGRYYPTRLRTFLRLAPDNAVQAAAMLSALRDAGCTHLAVLDSNSLQSYGHELAGLLEAERARYGLRIVSTMSLAAVHPALRRYLLTMRSLLPVCVAYVGNPSPLAASVLGDLHAELPRSPIIASDRVCAAALGRRAFRVRLTAAGAASLQCTFPAVPAGLQATADLLSAWRGAYGRRASPGPWGTYGYATMQLALRTIAGLGSSGDDRARVLRALSASHIGDSVLGSYAFRNNGDSTVRTYGLYQARAAGPPVLLRVLTPAQAGNGLS